MTDTKGWPLKGTWRLATEEDLKDIDNPSRWFERMEKERPRVPVIVNGQKGWKRLK